MNAANVLVEVAFLGEGFNTMWAAVGLYTEMNVGMFNKIPESWNDFVTRAILTFEESPRKLVPNKYYRLKLILRDVDFLAFLEGYESSF